MSTYPEEFKALEEKNEELEGLLKMAKCPNECINGQVMHTAKPEPCRWCYLRQQALKK